MAHLSYPVMCGVSEQAVWPRIPGCWPRRPVSRSCPRASNPRRPQIASGYDRWCGQRPGPVQSLCMHAGTQSSHHEGTCLPHLETGESRRGDLWQPQSQDRPQSPPQGCPLLGSRQGLAQKEAVHTGLCRGRGHIPVCGFSLLAPAHPPQWPQLTHVAAHALPPRAPQHPPPSATCGLFLP